MSNTVINSSEKKKKHHSGHFKMMLFMVFLLIAAFSVSIFVSYVLFNRSTRENRKEIINKAARLAAEQIDADKVDDWLLSGADESYMKTAEILRSICNNTPYVQYLYVYQIRPDGCHVVFDIETNSNELEQYDELPEVSSDYLGDIIDFDESFYDDLPTLLEGGRIDIKETDDSYGWLLTKYEPIFDSKGKCVAYVGVDVSMIGVNDYNHAFLRWIVVISVFFLLVLIVAGFHYYRHARKADEYDESERRRMEQHVMFEQTAEALAGAIDAKDKYTNGHSRRVAEYSEKIARAAGKNDEECEKIYFAALLHDVGKIGVPIGILTKNGRLTDEEFEQIKQHPVVGGNILSSIKQSPWLSIGARYHHERYDGKGYPEGKKGEDIPEIARIIAVADAYDAMTSNRSYRNAIPQHIVREEFVKGSGTQFDPDFAMIMIHMIDMDTEYNMKENVSGARMTSKESVRCNSIYNDCSESVAVTRRKVSTHLCSQPDENIAEENSLPSIIVFDSLDGKVHPGEENNRNILYFEYARIRLDGKVTEKNVRKSEVRKCNQKTDLVSVTTGAAEPGQRYKIEAVRNRDHLYFKISGESQMFEVILALPDPSRYAFFSLTGEHCEIHNIMVEVADTVTDWDDIPRIADEISYIKNSPSGNVPSIQVDGPRLDSTDGILIDDGITLDFHTISYPTARLVWHCPYLCLFSSSDGRVFGNNYREYLMLRLDGEYYTSDEQVENKVYVKKTEEFKGWDKWKEDNKNGVDCNVIIRREADKIMISTENLGIAIDSVSEVKGAADRLYIALTGDQCAITDIHVSRG